MFNRKIKDALELLCHELGYGYTEYLGIIAISQYRGNYKRQPVQYETFNDLQKQFNLLLDHLNLEIVNKGEQIQKKEAKNEEK